MFYKESFSHFIDAIMLFGGVIDSNLRHDRAILRVRKKLEHRRPLAWLISIMELHGVSPQLCEATSAQAAQSNGTAQDITYRAEPMFLLKEYQRWYQKGTRHLPDDVQVTTPMLVTWSVSAISCAEPASSGTGVLYRVPAADLLLDRVSQDAARLGWDLRPVSGGLCLPAEQRDEVERFLVRYVPRAAWDPGAPVCP